MQAETNREKDLSFARLCDIKEHVVLRINTLEGEIPRRSYTDILNEPDLRHVGHQEKDLSDLYITCQLWTDGKDDTLPYRTAWKDFPRSFT